jgi:Arc/MetJ-type ribon-helix-helix transcriptional regulator
MPPASPRRRGRPSIADEPNTPVMVRLPDSTFDRVYELARRDRTSMPEVVRRALTRLLDDDDDR